MNILKNYGFNRVENGFKFKSVNRVKCYYCCAFSQKRSFLKTKPTSFQNQIEQVQTVLI